MRDELKNAATRYASESGYSDENEREQRAYDFEEGEKYALKMVLEMYLDGKLCLDIA